MTSSTWQIKAAVQRALDELPAEKIEEVLDFETVAEILDLIWTGQVIAFILPVPSFFSRGANDVRTG